MDGGRHVAGLKEGVRLVLTGEIFRPMLLAFRFADEALIEREFRVKLRRFEALLHGRVLVVVVGFLLVRRHRDNIGGVVHVDIGRGFSADTAQLVRGFARVAVLGIDHVATLAVAGVVDISAPFAVLAMLILDLVL